MNSSPIVFDWTDDGVMRPRPMCVARCDKEFVVGERYALIQHEERSSATHNHFFACVNDAFMNLPEDLAGRFKTAEHLRKWALIKCGYCDERTVVFSTPADARRAAAFITPMDDYAVVLVKGTVVSIFTAKSQALRAMNKDEFQASKRDVLDLVAEMIGVSASALAAQSHDHQDWSEPDHDGPTITQPVAEQQQPNGAPQKPAGEPDGSEAPGQGAEPSSEPAAKPARKPRGPNKPKGEKAPATEPPPEEHHTETPTEAEMAQGRGALGDDPSKPQTPSGEVAAKAALPKNAPDYLVHARAYIAAATVPGDLETRWHSEKKLRTTCSVAGEDFDAIYNEFKARVAALKSGGAS